MKLFSWNINGLRAVLRKGALQAFLEAEHPDILCLQEIKARPDQIDYDFADYNVFWNPAVRPGYSGTAVLVWAGLNRSSDNWISGNMDGWPSWGDRQNRLTNLGASREDRTRPVYQLDKSGKAWTGDVAGGKPRGQDSFNDARSEGRIQVIDCNDFYLVNVYTPNSKPDLSRLALRHKSWDPEFLQLLKNLEQTKPVVTCGDFNAAHEEIDIARPKTNHHSAGFTDEERQGITNLINAGFTDTFRTLHPEDQRYTWWSHWGHARENNVGWRIDYFFISDSLKPRLRSADIYESVTGSDHCPISIELEV